jgi:hypothetical protein
MPSLAEIRRFYRRQAEAGHGAEKDFKFWRLKIRESINERRTRPTYILPTM